jgi:TonB-dependent starch-binding outer membrane protein SusC
VSTNNQGDFILQGVFDDDILTISSVGFYREEIAVNKQRFLLIQLRLAVNSLEEMVIKGYYSTSKKLNTGSVVKINGSQITNQPVSNPILGLEGLVPGLLVTQNNGLPGSRFKTLIRGQNSIQNGTSPLFVIDGVPFLSDNDALTQLNGILANSPFNSLDPNDIESIEILKDADATAIYGSRGSNGVILITTRKNKETKNSLSVNIARGWGKVARSMDFMNTQQYLEMRKEAFLNDSIIPANYNAPDLVSWDQNRYTDWKKEFIGGTAKTYNAQLRYSGGNELTKFSVGTGYYEETTVFPGDFGNKKITTDINIHHKSSNNKLNLNFITSYSNDNSLLPAQDLTTYINLPPNSYPLKDAAGKYIWREADYSVGNPLALLTQKNQVTTDRLTANSILAYRPINAFEIKLNIGYNKIGADEKIISPMSAQDPAYAPTGSAAFGDNFIRTWIIEPQVSYKYNLKTKMHIEALAGSTWQKTESERKLIIGDGYTNDALLSSIAAAPYLTASNSKVQYNYTAFFGRLGLDWDNKYVLNITGRRDGSSRFGPDNRFATFAAAGAAWIFSKELFIHNHLPFLSFGKLRGSYGTTGNDQIGNYQYLDTYKGTIYSYDGQPGLTPSRLFNSNYSWEENNKIEVAAELGFFEDKLTLSLNYYKNKSGNQIIRYSLPTQTGFTNVLLNFPGVVQNKGYEISVNAELIKNKSFQWNTTFNISHNKNRLVSFPGLANSSYASTYVIGKPLNAYRGLHFTGIDPQTGIYQFEDLNKDGIIDNEDYDYHGTTDPKYFGGLSNSFSYKGFQLNILLEFRKQLGYDAVYYSQTAPGMLVNQPVYTLSRWRKPGDAATYQRYTQDFSNPALYPATYNMGSSDAVLTDASYIRLKNIALSYTFPSRWVKKLNVVNWKLFLHVQNILTITKYKGHDPESQSLSSLPPLKMITIGTQVNF